jgi:hypothetical protein
MTIITPNSISGINSITAQSNSLNFYTTAGSTLSIGASVSGNITGNVTGNLTGNVTGNVAGNLSGNVTGNVNSSGVSTITTLQTGVIQTTAGKPILNTTGSVLQVITKNLTTQVLTTNTSSWTDIESQSITLSSSSNKVLVLVNYGVSGNGAIALYRGSTALTRDSTSTTYMHYENDSGSALNYDSGTLRTQFTIMNLDTPGSTSVTYTPKILAYQATQGFAVNPPPYQGTFSSLILMEIAA